MIETFKDKKVIIYGAGKIGRRVYNFFLKFNIPVMFFYDSKAELIKKVGNIDVVKPDFQNIKDKENYIVIVTPFTGNICNMIKENLIKEGFTNIITDRKFINSLIYYTCKHDNIKYSLQNCFFCPNSKQCDMFNNILNIKHDNNLIIPSLAILITNKCNLKCKGCIHLREYYTENDNITIPTTQLIKNLNTILNKVDFVQELVIVGGEAFLHEDFENIIKQILKLNKIGIIHIITNGTVIPKNKNIFPILSNPRIIIEISGYQKIKVELFITYMTKYNINYQYTPQMQWFNFGNFKDRNYSEEELMITYSSCTCISNDIFNGKLHKCSRSLFGTYLNLIPDFKSDYIEIDKIIDVKQIQEFLNKKYIEACKYCNGTSPFTIQAGEQNL